MKKELGKCYFCEKKVDEDLKRCPHCGQVLSGSKIHLILIGSVILAFTMFIFISQLSTPDFNRVKQRINKEPKMLQRDSNKENSIENKLIDSIKNLFIGSGSTKLSTLNKGNQNTKKVKSPSEYSSREIKKMTNDMYKAMGYSNSDIKDLVNTTNEMYESMGYSKNEILEMERLALEVYGAFGLDDMDFEDLGNLANEAQAALGYDSSEELVGDLMSGFFGSDSDDELTSENDSTITSSILGALGISDHTDSNRFKDLFYLNFNTDANIDAQHGSLISSYYDDLNFSDRFIKSMNKKSDNEVLLEIKRQTSFFDMYKITLDNLSKLKIYELLGTTEEEYKNLIVESKDIAPETLEIEMEGMVEWNSYMVEEFKLTKEEKKYVDKLFQGMYKDFGWK